MTDPSEQQMLEPENADARQNSASKKSCLKHRVLRDISNRQQGLEEPKKTKQVNFIVEKPDRPSTLTKNRSRRLPTRAAMQSPVNKTEQPQAAMQPEPTPTDRIAHIVDGLGDINRKAFFHGIKRLFCMPAPILATFQTGVTREFLDYFWSLKWSEDDLTEDEKDDYEEFRKFEVKFLAGAAQLPELPPTEPTFIILFNPPANHPYLTTHIAHFCEYDSPHRLMIVGDLSLMLDLSSQTIWDSITLLYCLVTMHDRSRSALFTGLTSHHLGQSAGIPSLTLNFLRNQKPDGDDPVFFWNIKPNDRRVRILAMKMYLLHQTRAPINTDWTYNGISMLDIAHSCGCLVVEDRGLETPESSLVALESSAQKEYSGKWVLWSEALLKMFFVEHVSYLKDVPPKSTEVGWLLLEQITAQNMARHFKEFSQTLGQRFTFLTASFVAKIKHEIDDKYILLPQISEDAMNLPTSLLDMTGFSSQTTVNPNDFWKFVKNVLPPNRPLVTRDKGSTPDWMVKLVDGDKQHLLCIQLKAGTTEYSIDKVIDELVLSPGVTLVDKAYGYRSIVFSGSTTNDIKLTFIFGAMVHKGVKKQLLCLNGSHLAKGSDSHFGALRVTHESYPAKIPKNVELIILLKSGLVNLLGEENYNFIKKFNANTVFENRTAKALNASFSENIDSQEVKDVLNESQLDPRSLSSTEVKDKLLKQWNEATKPYCNYFDITWGSDGTLHVTPKKDVPKSDADLEVPKTNTSPSHTVTDTSHPASPISASEKGNASESESESESESSVESTQRQGTVRRERENDAETAAEHVSKKFKNDKNTTAPIAGALATINNQEKTADE